MSPPRGEGGLLSSKLAPTTRLSGPNKLDVITGLVPVIHVLLLYGEKDVDGRVKPGHDDVY
jgi:hypothetical protein